MKTSDDLYRRRFARNVFVGVVLAAFVTLIFFVTLAKLQGKM